VRRVVMCRRAFITQELTPMLVLSRKLNEKIMIDGEIEIIVVRIDRNQVRLAIRAPDHIKIMRNELYCNVELPE
jgi:carbon storage regulator